MAAVSPAGPEPRMTTFRTSSDMGHLSRQVYDVYRPMSIQPRLNRLLLARPFEELKPVALRVDERGQPVALRALVRRGDERHAARLELGDGRVEVVALQVGDE